MNVTRLFRRGARAFGYDLQPVPYSTRCVTLPHPDPRGRVLIAYVLEPFLRRAGTPISASHTNLQEAVLMANAWLEAGFGVDVIDYHHAGFLPMHRYDYMVSSRVNLKAIADRLNQDCVKIAHFDTSHYVVNNLASLARMRDLEQRRGVALPRGTRIVEANEAIETADYGVVLGNEVTVATYEHAGKPLFPLNLPASVARDWDADKDFDACRNRFLWLGSHSLVHKGLDLVIEAFAEMPDLHLTVCGPLDREPGFRRLYVRKLDAPNIDAYGWIDVAGDAFRELAGNTMGTVHPSCAEGQAGAVVNCMSAGMIPIVSQASGLSVTPFGTLLPDCSIAAIRTAVRNLAAESAARLEERARQSVDHAQAHFSTRAYAARYKAIVDQIVAGVAARRGAALGATAEQ